MVGARWLVFFHFVPMRGLLPQRTWLLVGRRELVVLVTMRDLVCRLRHDRGLIHHHLVLDRCLVVVVSVVPGFRRLGFLRRIGNLQVVSLYPAVEFQILALFVRVSIAACDQVLLPPEGQGVERLGEQG